MTKLLKIGFWAVVFYLLLSCEKRETINPPIEKGNYSHFDLDTIPNK